jgi:hypothetical protein
MSGVVTFREFPGCLQLWRDINMRVKHERREMNLSRTFCEIVWWLCQQGTDT